jgi:hypothetical protein
MKQYLINVWMAFDRFLNAVLGGNPKEVLSVRMGRNIREGRCKLCFAVCWLLDLLDKNHCQDAAEGK